MKFSDQITRTAIPLPPDRKEAYILMWLKLAADDQEKVRKEKVCTTK